MENLIPQTSLRPARIGRLSSDLINQIAAGEVVERPSSLIKELVENSLDAQATRIEVHLFEGGLKEITLIDNGLGICEEDLPLAVERHTTSKLKQVTDLESISTFGFRGEALSSIASVSDFSIRSRPFNQDRGMSLQVKFGEKQEIKPTGTPPGTQISVKDLFARLPARFKFLRAQATELSHCVKVFKELALGNPQTAFFLHHNGRLLSQYTATQRQNRFLEVLKPEWEPQHFQDSNEEMKFEAFLSPLNWTQERGDILLLINQRPVKNRLLLSCIKNSFLEMAGPHHEPSGVFYLDIRGDWVDVNVHPQKLEVRFFRQERIYSWLLTSLKKQLLQLKRLHPEHFKTYPSTFSPSPNNNLNAPISQSPSNPLRFFGTTRSGHWIFETLEGLFLVDPKALKRREISLQWAQKNAKIEGKSLPLPVVLSMSQTLYAFIQKNLELFPQLGFDLELYGDKDIAIKSVPEALYPSPLEEPFMLWLNKLALNRPPSQESLQDFAIKTLISVFPLEVQVEPLGNDTLTQLLSQMDESWTCPLGKPVLLKLSWTQLEQHFKSI